MDLDLAPKTALESALNLRMPLPQPDIRPELIGRADEGKGRVAERPTIRKSLTRGPVLNELHLQSSSAKGSIVIIINNNI